MFFCVDTNWLLQRAVCRTAGFHVSAFTTCSSRCCSFCWPRDHVTAALMALHWLCVHVSHINYVPWCTQLCVDTGHSTWWTCWCLCHNFPAGLIYVQLKKGNSIHRIYALPLDQDPFLSQLHRHGITCRLTFDGSPPSPPSRDTSRPIRLYSW